MGRPTVLYADRNILVDGFGNHICHGGYQRMVIQMNSNFIALQHLRQELARQDKMPVFIDYVKQLYQFGFFKEEKENERISISGN